MKRLIVTAIRAYQALTRNGAGNPFLFGTISGCRSWPTCSEYAISTVETDGVVKGLMKSMMRVARCNPLWPAQHHG